MASRGNLGTGDEVPQAAGANLTDFFSLPFLWLLGAFVAFGLVTYAISVGFLWLSHAGLGAKSTPIPVAPFFTAMTTVWALSFGFTAAEIWAVNTDAGQAANAERSALMRLAGMADRNALDLPVVIDGLRAYEISVETKEWGENHNKAPAAEVDLALQHIRLAIVAAAKQGALPVLVSKMVQDFDELQDARSERLAFGRGSHSAYKWYLVVFLTMLSQIAIASVHADRPRAGRKALAIFTIAATVSLWILALHANPYVGVQSLDYGTIHVPL